MSLVGIATLTLFVILTYAFLCARIATAVQPVRLQMAEIGEELIAVDDFPQIEKKFIALELERTYSSIFMWIALIVLPIAVVFVVVDNIRGKKIANDAIPVGQRKQYEKFRRLSWVSRFASSPLAGAIFVPLAIFVTVLLLIVTPKKAWFDIQVSSKRTDAMIEKFSHSSFAH